MRLIMLKIYSIVFEQIISLAVEPQEYAVISVYFEKNAKKLDTQAVNSNFVPKLGIPIFICL